MNNREAFNKGWTASRTTKTYDLGAAEERFEAKHGGTTGTMFAAGWTAYATGEHASPSAAWDELMARAEALPSRPDELTPAGVQLAIEAELDQADAELAAVERPRDDAGIPPGPDNPPLNQLWTRGDDWTRLIGLAERAGSMAASTPGILALNRLDYLTEIIEQAERMRAGEVDNARNAGESWQAIGAQLGSSKQAAQQRYGKKP